VKNAIVKRILTIVVSTVAMAWLASGTAPAREPADSRYGAVMHATVTISGGINCADAAKIGTNNLGRPGVWSFQVPIPPPNPGGNPGSVSGGHTFSTDAGALPYHGPGTYTGKAINATQMDVDTPPGSEDRGIFAFSENIGTIIINPDASGSFQFNELQDPNSVTIYGKLVWTCTS
jgi:hypothetical protein